MVIERTDNELIIKIPNNLKVDAIQDLIDIVNFKVIQSKSIASKTDIKNIVDSIDNNLSKNSKKFYK